MDMCNYSSYVRKQGERQTELKNLQALMKNMNLSAKQAMDALSVPQADREKYSKLLAQ